MREWLKDLRRQKGLTSMEMAEKLGLTATNYCKIENGTRQKKMDIDMVVKLADFFSVSTGQIIQYEQEARGKHGTTT